MPFDDSHSNGSEKIVISKITSHDGDFIEIDSRNSSLSISGRHAI